MTLGKGLSKKHLCLSLLASVVAACGAETPAFQEKTMAVLMDQQQNAEGFSSESYDNTADATVATSDEDELVDDGSVDALQLPQGDEASDLTVDVKDSQLRFGAQTTSISTSLGGNKTDDVVYKAIAPAGKDPGAIINGNTYVSPVSGTEAYEVKIIAVSKSDPTQTSSTVLKLEPSTQVFAGCTNDLKGFPIKADVYQIPEGSQRLPDFTAFSKTSATACMEAFQIPNRAWSDGFPGQPSLIEWFAIRATSNLTTNSNGKYYFKLNADDGAKLYIDGQLVVDNDGQHAEKAVVGSINLTKGQHEIVVEYFQGPRYHIALELFWKTPGSSTYTYVPASAFKP
ncbi:MAG TPA: PA14 domain-containing protein [Oligoflexus sp.]|uniref:PA14 domain-containing protein n=1 Tax=Oligoflexus sp. TaxID=1971216 RepID=UPI002D7FA037|nr:PA14 domain-containing protein [Oligoflexus sp.]HET9238109.1 PA14 domain-containing protein [Oligoflexus sp.]